MCISTSPFFCRVRISGEAGEGISSAGALLHGAAARYGLRAAAIGTIPSTIRGGYVDSLVTISDSPIRSSTGRCDILCVLSAGIAPPDQLNVKERGIVLFDAAAGDLSLPGLVTGSGGDPILRMVKIPFAAIAEIGPGGVSTRSMVALGVVGRMLRLDIGYFVAAIGAHFAEKGASAIASNCRALTSGYEWARENVDDREAYRVPGVSVHGKEMRMLVIDGNQAVSMGALAAGCTFFASYPITPATSIGEMLTRQLPLQGGCAYQAEDEIAALGAVIGASFGGAKAMTATSGPGLSLMQEFIGYASMTELPAVIVNVQRAGPSTGMPTRHSQDDLLAAVFGGHGEAPRIVIAPQSVEDCFTGTVTAFSCAEKYQCPVIVLSDAALGSLKKNIPESTLVCPEIIGRETILKVDDDEMPFRRFRTTASGTNPLPVPGLSSVTYRITGVEHTEDSAPAASSQERMVQVEKRSRKLVDIESEVDNAVVWDLEPEGKGQADVGIIAWGFSVAATGEAIAELRSRGYRIGALYPRLLYPVCTTALNRFAAMFPLQIVVEANSTGQFRLLARMFSDARPESLASSRPEPLTPEEIIRGIVRICGPKRKGTA